LVDNVEAPHLVVIGVGTFLVSDNISVRGIEQSAGEKDVGIADRYRGPVGIKLSGRNALDFGVWRGGVCDYMLMLVPCKRRSMQFEIIRISSIRFEP
jgi:hypothetical protein